MLLLLELPQLPLPLLPLLEPGEWLTALLLLEGDSPFESVVSHGYPTMDGGHFDRGTVIPKMFDAEFCLPLLSVLGRNCGGTGVTGGAKLFISIPDE